MFDQLKTKISFSTFIQKHNKHHMQTAGVNMFLRKTEDIFIYVLRFKTVPSLIFWVYDVHFVCLHLNRCTSGTTSC